MHAAATAAESEVVRTSSSNYLQPSGLGNLRTRPSAGVCPEDEDGGDGPAAAAAAARELSWMDSSSPTIGGGGGGGPLPYSVAVLGAPRVGKTTLVQQLLTSEYLANKECNSPGTKHSFHASVRPDCACVHACVMLQRLFDRIR